MDLGFGGLIEKIEEYFGRTFVRVLMLLLSLVVLGWAAQTFVGAVLAVEDMIEADNGFLPVLGHLIRIGWAVLLGVALILVMKRTADRRMQVTQAKLDELTTAAETMVKDARADAETARAQAEQALAQAERALALRDRYLEEVEAGITELERQHCEIDSDAT